MDKIPKLRRKPKPPTIETNVERTSTDTSESAISNAVAVEIQRPSSTHRQYSNDWFKSKSSGKKSPFRNLRLRSAKRARESSPAGSSSGGSLLSLPGTSQGGVKVPRNERSSRHSPIDPDDGSMEDLTSGPADPGPQMPAFLQLSKSEIDQKLQDLNWEERSRAVLSQREEGEQEPRFGTFKQTDIPERGAMDRYVNIKPWNHNRVRLRVPEGQFNYVNASTIELSSPSDPNRPQLRYIAMQGPTQPSVPYVWRMIAEQVESPIVIVQLTSMVESGQMKCYQYFPHAEEGTTWELNEDDVWEDDWRATLTYEWGDTIADGAIRKTRLRLQVEGEEPRVVWHFLYKRWPDFGTPAGDNLEGFFTLMKLSREHSSPGGPRIIHCSAGVGRTGTFIALEHLIREFDVGGLSDPPPAEDGHTYSPDLIYDTVDFLRQQRRGMVQGEIQYRFIYYVMRKMWEDKYMQKADDDDEDMAEGGASIRKPEEISGPSNAANMSDPFYDPDINDDDDDDDDGGAKVKPDAAPSGK